MKKNIKEKTILIRLETEQYNQFKELCKKHGFNMSQRFRNFINNEILKLKNNEKL